MGDWDRQAALLVRNHIHVWMQVPRFKPLAQALRKDEALLVNSVAHILAAEGKTKGETNDEARLFLIHHAMEQVRIALRVEHFVLFRETETVEVILEDAFDKALGPMADRIVFPHQGEIARVVARCLFRKGGKQSDLKDITTFLGLFSNGGATGGAKPDPDRAMRHKSMVWFAYLLTEIVKNDSSEVCRQGVPYFRARIVTLLDRALAGAIIDEDSGAAGHNFEGGKWNRSLFGWLQGEDRKPFVQKLVRQFNLENRKDHVNRVLLAEHRDCMYRQALALFCHLFMGETRDDRQS